MSALNRLPPAIFLMGPTASGKTAVSLELTLRFPLEIVSVDSAQVFRDMDIGTAKPDRATLAQYPHHLIDLITPEESYSAARFRADALRVMGEITARGKIPLLAGGTMLYFKALREGLSDLPQANAELRRAIDAEARERGWPALHAELARLDPEAAARLKPTDAQRIQRALEVVRLTGAPLAESLARRTEAAAPYRLVEFALLPSDRAVLHARIAQRFDAMLAAGLIDEVKALRAEKIPPARRPAVDALRRLPTGVGLPRGHHRQRRLAREGHRRHAPAGQATADLAAQLARRRGPRLPRGRPRRAGRPNGRTEAGLSSPPLRRYFPCYGK
jgi:tRNA dimethylallyltransferase